jgi:fatty acid desaturase
MDGFHSTTRAPISAESLKALAVRSDRRGLMQFGGHFGAIAAAIGLVIAARHSWALLPAMALLGLLEAALFAPLHESTHRTTFRRLWLNRISGWVGGFVLVLPPDGFRLFHLAHHRHTQDPERDPELIGARPLTRLGYVWLLTGLPYWASQTRGLLKTALGNADAPWIPAASRAMVVREARLYLALYILTALTLIWSPLALLLWVVPMLLGQPVLRAVLMAEHRGCPENGDRMANTRTTLASRAFGLLFWNANLHIEHHWAPGVPFHALPKLHILLRPHLKTLERGYSAAHATIRAGLS